ncbi:MAG: MBL fold metallo-hydrolase [Actinomycetota bacterium]|nr:MBL fold metallo-hydrolase [Actinomycetota bacterium]MDA2971303.1 MBL fold metallo-hydrolase [Actinomycetota bacterium]MDA3001730.1 MBL fold metallo-hydrolase [Actinomycetota bacterium]
MADDLYFRQLLSGHDFASGDPLAHQMVNFVYLIGDRTTGECVVVDPAYGVDELIDIAAADGMHLTGVLATHYHPDHVGGSMMGHRIEGVARLLERVDVPIHVNRNEAPWVEKTTGVGAQHLVLHDGGDVVRVGRVEIECVHTPGHTPGSQCFRVRGALVSGDTLFLDGCGRTDLPGSDPEAMFDSLRRLDSLPDQTVIFPGHRYSEAPAEELSDVRRHNFVLKPTDKEQWLSIFAS